MADEHYNPDYADMGRWLRSDEAYQAVHEVAERGAHFAAGSSPFRTGRYRGSIGVDRTTGWDGRAAAEIVVDVEYGAAVEHDHHVLARTAQMLES
jgi:hypothetical protein